jgi:hypothetical protein
MCVASALPAHAAYVPLRQNGDHAASATDPDVEWLKAILLNSANPADVRRGAAERLLAKQSPAALDALREALQGDAGLLPPVLSAIESVDDPPAVLLGPIVRSLTTAPKELWLPLARAAAKYGQDEQGLNEIARLATDSRRPVAERLGPITALSTFHNLESARTLMQLLDVEASEPREITAAAMDALERMTGMPYGADGDAWRIWWRQAKDLPFDEWLRGMVRSLTSQNSTLQKEAEGLRAESNKQGARLAELYGEIFLTLPASARIERLPRLLTDDVAAVRLFALTQVDRMLRNGERPPEAFQQRVLERLADASPLVRIRAAKLLDDLGYADTADVIANAMLTEKDPEVQAAYLTVLANRPSAESMDTIFRGLRDPLLAETAATAAERLFLAEHVPDDMMDALREAAREAASGGGGQGVWRLLTIAGADEDVALAVAQLDAEDDAVRAGVAAGLRSRGMLEPLLEHAQDDAVYPSLVEALADGPADIDRFRRLAGVPPAPAQRAMWAGAVERLAAGLGLADLRAADDFLQASEAADARLRLDVLERVGDLATNNGDADVVELQRRLLALWIEAAETRRIAELLDRVGPMATGPEWQSLRFRGALMTGRFSQAAGVKNDARAWLDELAWLAQRDVRSAIALQEEIGRRFAADLTGPIKAEFDALKEGLARQTLPSASAVVPTFR